MPANPICTLIGAGPGLGRAIAERYAHGGFSVGLIARDARRLQEQASLIRARGQGAATASGDAGDAKSLRTAIANVESQLDGPTTVLIYNAVAFSPGTPLQLSPETIQSDYRINVTGALVAAQAV